MNKENGRTLNNYQSIEQSIEDILLTPINSRIMRRNYGSLLFNFLDKPQTQAQALYLKIAVSIFVALSEYEPRIELKEVKVIPQNKQNLMAVINYKIKNQLNEIKRLELKLV